MMRTADLIHMPLFMGLYACARCASRLATLLQVDTLRDSPHLKGVPLFMGLYACARCDFSSSNPATCRHPA